MDIINLTTYSFESLTFLGYIDGGSGSLILQAAISGILGGIFVLKSFIRNLKLKKVASEVSTNELVQDELKAA